MVWQRRAAFAIAIAAASYAAGLLWSFKSASNSSKLGAFSWNIGARSAQAQTIALGESEVIDSLVTRVSGLDAAQKQIYDYAVPKQFQGQIIKDISVPSGRKVIALTFDDGPWPKSTNEVLSILKKYDIKATFFVVGQNVKSFPELAQKVVKEGHIIANHSWNHPYRHHTREAAAQQIDRTDDIIYKTTGVKSAFFRPPGGILKNGLATYAAEKNDVIAMWSADSQDYRASSAAQIHNVMRDAGQGGVVLMHDGGGDRHRTVAALPTIIENLRNQGYEFVTLPELLDLKAKAAQQPKVEAQKSQTGTQKPAKKASS
ncbi:polysaccharide deacetylase family protein [Oscillatoria sp. FACHB-1406]|nr:polysaccharide deacetylase family protein [Oscillatoria sp. FACHB-1406]